MSRLQCRGIFLPVKSKVLMGRVNAPESLMGCEALELNPPVCLSVGTALRWCREEAEWSGGSLPALLSVSPCCDTWRCRFIAWSEQVS